MSVFLLGGRTVASPRPKVWYGPPIQLFLVYTRLFAYSKIGGPKTFGHQACTFANALAGFATSNRIPFPGLKRRLTYLAQQVLLWKATGESP